MCRALSGTSSIAIIISMNIIEHIMIIIISSSSSSSSRSSVIVCSIIRIIIITAMTSRKGSSSNLVEVLQHHALADHARGQDRGRVEGGLGAA